ncbi:heparan-alpha-glucosaminide N-acetyltransferase domain-containing protein [Arenibacter sp. GZD96]|uniref:heparan-alpha-glucosaminide N-acetyltransferase domain-containing protein n=1 Tax=Aurantibrevibacter litoralis TaxID=3106030 RepID=UPI002AFFE172|nr:heparan-alpha-glucosaminide N-acetyltransferase domain-containing protein [Arenibacter sp. GZD-96]MEA1786072.1 heparan-alpha-glucosaminide N-acetyltransferase domain-containing protein [Arenibacter sp. GZD-96]
MERTNYRLYFIDAMRAWAILMMLQGHFVDGLLDNAFRDNTNLTFAIWKYFRGITAPVFFTVSGFIFTYLLVKGDKIGMDNPRVEKGIKRGLQLLFIGYLLRLNFTGLLQGQLYNAFYLVDVLHCIGLSILGIVALYVLTITRKNKSLFPIVLVGITIVLFVLEPFYKTFSHSYLPQLIANYFTKANGSVFTIIPWFGYASFGAFLSLGFTKYKEYRYLYPAAIAGFSALGGLLIYYSSGFFLGLSQITGLSLFSEVYYNNYLFIRLGNVLIVFAVFMLLNRLLMNRTLLKIGQSTLSIYVIHFMLLYGSFTGLGLYRFFNHSLSPSFVIPGAFVFIVLSTYSALQFEKNKDTLKGHISLALKQSWILVEPWYHFTLVLCKEQLLKLRLTLMRLFGIAEN